MENINQELTLLINQNQFVSEEDKKIWKNVIEDLPETFCRDIFEFIKSYPDRAGLLTNNLKEKIDAIKNQDIKRFESILNNDKQLLEALKQ